MKVFLIVFLCLVLHSRGQDLQQVTGKERTRESAELSEKSRRGEGIPINEKLAYTYAKVGAEAGEPLGNYNLAECYQYGVGTAKNYKRAWELYKKSVEGLRVLSSNNNNRAQFALATMYENGNGVKPNLDSMNLYLQMAAKNGLAVAQMSLGKKLLPLAKTTEDTTNADEYLRKAAEQRHAESMLVWSNRLSQSLDTTKERVAFLFARNAAQLNYPLAKYVVGAYYYSGYGIARDTVESLTWFTQAANDGLELACFELGYRYTYGYGVPKDAVKARKWLLTLSAIGTDLREKTYKSYHAMLDTIPTTDSCKRAAISSTIAWIKNYHTIQNHTSTDIQQFLCGNARKLWKRTSFFTSSVSNQSEIIALATNKTLRKVFNNDELLSTTEGTWELDYNAEHITFSTDSGKSVYSLLLVSPSILMLVPMNTTNVDVLSSALVYEQLLPAEAVKAGGFNSRLNKFAEPKVKFKKSEISANGNFLTITFTLKNIPDEGINIQPASYRFDDDNKTNEYLINPEHCKGEDVYYTDGDYIIQWDLVRGVSKKGRGDCVINMECGWMFDGKYNQFDEALKPIDITPKKK